MKVLKHNNLKLIYSALIMGFVLTLTIQGLSLSETCNNIKDSVLRLHIVANSDSQADQNLKIKVRDRLLKEGKLYLGNAENESEALTFASKNLPLLQKAAQEEIEENGYNYCVNVSLGQAWFNTREYDDVTLPAGEYEALKVVIGEGKGKNWWCVMFPPMCVSAAEEVASDSGPLTELLNDDEEDLVMNGQKYRVKFKSVEVYESIKEKVKKWF